MTDSHYIDNKEFFAEMVKWKTLVVEAEESGDPKPPVTEYIGQCFLLIAERLSTRPNFVNYPFRDEMVGDAIENCLMYAPKSKKDDAAKAVTKTKSGDQKTEKKTWKLSDIQKMKPFEFDKYEKEIDLARKEGRIVQG